MKLRCPQNRAPDVMVMAVCGDEFSRRRPLFEREGELSSLMNAFRAFSERGFELLGTKGAFYVRMRRFAVGEASAFRLGLDWLRISSPRREHRLQSRLHSRGWDVAKRGLRSGGSHCPSRQRTNERKGFPN